MSLLMGELLMLCCAPMSVAKFFKKKPSDHIIAIESSMGRFSFYA